MGRSIFLFTFCLLPLGGWSEESSQKNDLDAIEQQIQVLKNSLKQHELKEMDIEVKGQGDMIADWPAYSKDIEQIRQQDEKERQIQSEIQQLERQKAELMKQAKQGT